MWGCRSRFPSKDSSKEETSASRSACSMLRSFFFLSPVRCSRISENLFGFVRASPSLGCYAPNQGYPGWRHAWADASKKHAGGRPLELSLRRLELASAQFQDVIRQKASFEYPPKIVHTTLIPTWTRQGVLPNSTRKGSHFREALPFVAVAFMCVSAWQ